MGWLLKLAIVLASRETTSTCPQGIECWEDFSHLYECAQMCYSFYVTPRHICGSVTRLGTQWKHWLVTHVGPTTNNEARLAWPWLQTWNLTPSCCMLRSKLRKVASWMVSFLCPLQGSYVRRILSRMYSKFRKCTWSSISCFTIIDCNLCWRSLAKDFVGDVQEGDQMSIDEELLGAAFG